MSVFEQWESENRAYCRAYPAVFSHARNARQIDEDGNEYIDFFAGAGVMNFGHNNPRMKEALLEYIAQDGITHSLDLHTRAKREFIETFVDVVLKPRGMQHRLQFMGPTGTNAVEIALKIARRVTGRRHVVAFHHAFHGMTLGSLACTGNQYFRDGAGVALDNVWHEPFGCETPCAGCTVGCGMERLDQLRARLTDTSAGMPKPAAFLVEAIQAEGGVNVADRQWLQALAQLAKDLGALLIVDDIQAGCGRTGSYFSFDDAGIDPDIICLAKGIGGYGTPLAINLVKPEHDDQWSPGVHTGTFRGQNLSFVAGRVGLEYFRDDTLLAEVRRKGALLREGLQGISGEHTAHQFQVRGKGMMLAIDLRDPAIARQAAANCRDERLIVCPCGIDGRAIKVIPPLTIPGEDLVEGMERLQRAIRGAVDTVEQQA